MQLEKVKLLTAGAKDLSLLTDLANEMRNEKDVDYFEVLLQLQKEGLRTVYLAKNISDYVGYCLVNWSPKYGLYKRLNIPEIQDLNVLPKFRRCGIGKAMIEHCEKVVKKRGFKHIGIGVGLDASFGSAQRLYVKMGYVPDGNGVTYDRINVRSGEMRPIDDDLSLMLVKDI